MSQPFCSNCHSSEFFEDDQGYFVCKYCGTMSQDFYAETNDMEDGAVTSNMRRVIERVKTPADSKKSSQKQIAPELSHFLEVYQYCLKMLLHVLLDLAGAENEQHSEHFFTLKSLWLDYLTAWNKSTSECDMTQAFCGTNLPCTCPPKGLLHPLHPSKPLLLGFVYLTLRLHRSWITIPDIIHFCLSGQLPYSNLWEAIPNDVKAGRLSEKHKKLFCDQHMGETRFVSCANVLFHAASIADTVGIELPPLNDHLIASVLISRFGFPAAVWERYLQVSQAHTGGEPITAHAGSTPLLYVEEVLVLLAMAVKCTKGWERWSIVSLSPTTGSHVGSDGMLISGAGSVLRKDLKEVLGRLRAVVARYTVAQSINPSRQPYHFNEAVLASMATGAPLQSLCGETTEGAMPEVLLLAVNTFELTSKESKGGGNGRVRDQPESGSDLVQYLTYARYSQLEEVVRSGEGEYSLPYVLLLERLAAWALVPPGLLHRMLVEAEEVLFTISAEAREECW